MMGNGKLGLQIQRPSIPTRTERRLEIRQEEVKEQTLRASVSQAKTKLSTAQTVDEYETIYNTISPNIQRFFSSPQELRDANQNTINTNLERVDTRIQFYQDRIGIIKERIQKNIAWFNSKSGRARDNAEDSFRRNEIGFENDLNEAGYYIGFWQQARGRFVEKGFTYGQAQEWVQGSVEYRLAKEGARREAREKQRQIEEKFESAERIELIEEFDKGVPQGRKIFAIDGEERTLIQEIKPTDVSKLKPSDLKKTRIKETFEFGRKKVAFETTQQLFKTPQGKLITPFSMLSVTEEQIKEQRKKEVIQEKFKTDIGDIKIEEPSIEKEQKSFLKKSFDFIGDVFSGAFFKTSIGLAGKTEPTGLSTKELKERRKDILATQFKSTLPSFLVKGRKPRTEEAIAKGIIFSKDIRESGEKELAIQKLQTEKIEDVSKTITALNKQVEGKELTLTEMESFNNQLVGELQKLGDVGVKTEVKQIEGEEKLVFTSKSFEKDISPATIKLLRSAETKKQKAFEITGALGTEAVEFGSIGYLTGGLGLVPRATKGAKKIKEISTIAKLLRAEKVILKGGRTITVLGTLQTPKLTTIGKLAKLETKLGISGGIGQKLIIAKTKLPKISGKALNVGIVGLAGGTTIVGGVRGFKAGTERDVKISSAIIGAGKPLTQFTSFGIGALKGGGIPLRTKPLTQPEIRSIAIKDFQREQRIEQLKNIKDLGQFSRRATFETIQLGTGKKVDLNIKQIREFTGIVQKQTGLSPKEARNLIKQSSVFEQELKVKSVLGDEFKFKRIGLDVSASLEKQSKQMAFEFNKAGSRVSDFTIKLTTAGEDKRFLLTHIFRKRKITPKTPDLTFKLDKILGTKVSKFKKTKFDEGKELSTFQFETRLIKGQDKLQKDFGKLKLKEILDIGLKDIDTKFIKTKFKRAGEVGRVDIGKGIRLDIPRFKDVGEGIRIAKEEEFLFKQISGSKPSISLKNILKDLKEVKLKKQIKKTPLSTTFAKGVEQELTKLPKGTTDPIKLKVDTKVDTKQININALIKDIQIKTKIKTRTKVKQFPKTALKSELGLVELLKVGQLQKNQQAFKNKSILKTQQLVKQNQLLKTQQLTKTSQIIGQLELIKPITMTTIPISTKIPKLPSIPKLPQIPLLKSLKKKKRRGKKKLKEENIFAFVEGFTARAIDLSPEIIKKQNIKKLLQERKHIFAIQRRPIIK